ncbi:MAG: DNA-processing protein DprA [Alistipes sp.]|nr:DNA-processing protein DprA [Alistipes sp.]
MTVEDIALQMTPGIGVKGAVHLLECFGTAERIFAATEDELIGQAELRPEPARQILRRAGFAAAEKEIKHCRKHDIKAIASTDPDYPALLREIPDYPHVIYVKGDPQALAARSLTVVGTRDMTSYGLNMCNKLVCRLAERVPHLTIVSGLAFGIDIAAHRAALVSGIPTVSVLPCALPGIVPAQHTAVARDMLDHGGALLTELHSQTRQNGTAYLARNRIIAALGAGCVIVESPDGGGSLITARFADEYDRTVMAVPGRATDRSSSGTNHLIRNRKAQLVLSAEDIIVEMGWDLETEPAILRVTPEPQALTREETSLLECFRTSDPLSVDTLRELSGLDPGALAALLLGLELAGAVRQLPGNRYMKL